MRYCPQCKATYLSMIKCPRDGQALTTENGDPMLGVVLGDRYRVLERIAAGGMGQVYRAAHTRIASLCAVKVLFGELAGETDMRTRFSREAESASILQSRYITRVLDFGETDGGLLYLVMELLEGVCLSSAITRAEAFTEDRAARIVRKIALGLAHAHERGIIHRDLKPQNVMLVTEDDEREVPKILDFGLARINQRPGVTMPGMVMGTPDYMAPEAFLANHEVDARTDLYALGVILYQAVTGRTPFDAPSPNAIFLLHAKAAPPPFSVARPGFNASRRFEDIVFKLLEKKPDDRFASARALADALDFKFEPGAEVTRKAVNPLPPDPWDQALARIQAAIAHGAPLYNAGDSKGCADLYLRTAEELIAIELAPSDQAVFRSRLASAVQRAIGREPQAGAWALRHSFDDLLFAMAEVRRRPKTPTKATRSRFTTGCPGLVRLRAELDLAALVAARRYEAGHADMVGDFFLTLAAELVARLEKEGTCEKVRKRLEVGLENARQSSSRIEAAAILGDAFDDVRFDGSSQAPPPAEAAVLAASEQIEAVGTALVAAISTGSALYNGGDIEGCARLYLDTAAGVTSGLKAGARNAPLKRLLTAAIAKAEGADFNDAAWTLRHAFDAVLEAWRIAKEPTSVSAVKRGKVAAP